MGYYGKDKFIGWDPVKNQRYLKSEAMEKLLGENKGFASRFNSTQEKRVIFDAMQAEMNRGKKKLTNEGMLRAIGTAHRKGVISQSQIKPLLYELFSDTIPGHVQRDLIFGMETTEEIEAEEKKEEPENQPPGSEENTDEDPEPKKGLFSMLGF